MEMIYGIIVGYYTEIILVTLSGFVVYIFKYMRALNRGVKAILRNNIIHVYNASMERGFMPIYEQDALHNLHESYKAMGGNGTIEQLMKEMSNLPTHDGPTVPVKKE